MEPARRLGRPTVWFTWAAGIVATDDAGGFVFAGFLPSRSGEREAAVRKFSGAPRNALYDTALVLKNRNAGG